MKMGPKIRTWGIRKPQLPSVSVAAAGFPAAQGWYSSIAAPHMLDDAKLTPWLASYRKRWDKAPSDYAITAYDAALVVLAAIETVAKSGAAVIIFP